MSAIAMLAAGVLGGFLRNLLGGPHTADTAQRRHFLQFSVVGRFGEVGEPFGVGRGLLFG